MEGQETRISECEKDLDAKTALKIEFASRQLPLVPLYRFNGDASHCPGIIERFYMHIHCNLHSTTTSEWLTSLVYLDSEAKKAIEAVKTCGLFYVSALKTLKKEFGNTLIVAHLCLKSMFNKPQIKSSDRSALQEFHLPIKLNITWLASLGYKTPLYLYESVTKNIPRLLLHLRKIFYKHTKDASSRDDTLNLIMFES